VRRLGFLDKGGLVRIGAVHYNTAEEVDRFLAELARIAGGKRSWPRTESDVDPIADTKPSMSTEQLKSPKKDK
jgi:hypothetical protein